MKKTRLGIIGFGKRGSMMLRDNFIHFDNVDFTAICDLYEDRVEEGIAFVKEHRGNEPFGTTNYKEVLTRDDVDAVYVSSSWEYHIEISIAALRAGKAVAMEVGGAYSIDECFELVKAYEETGTPFMLMENCCYGKNELLANSLARAGKLGTVVHAQGAYAHDLREEISTGNIKRHYRLRNYTLRNCDNYPTHELGPIAKILNVNRGNRMVSLVSMSSKACGLSEYIADKELWREDPTLKDRTFMQGDIVTTIIKCAGGETILLRLDTTLPRSYTRDFVIRGTKGLYDMNTNTVFLDGMEEFWEPVKYAQKYLDNGNEFEDYLPPVWRNFAEEMKKYGHGGMDAVEFGEFLSALQNGKEMPIDVYDAAAWMCISALSEQSIAMGGAPVEIPDFTNGKWIVREQKDVFDFTSPEK